MRYGTYSSITCQHTRQVSEDAAEAEVFAGRATHIWREVGPPDYRTEYRTETSGWGRSPIEAHALEPV